MNIKSSRSNGIKLTRIGLSFALAMILLPIPASATNPLDGQTISFAAGANLGASLADVNSGQLGDLDNDGDLDLVTASASAEDYEIIAWQNDGTPFDAVWPSNDVGAAPISPTAYSAYRVVLADLDRDGRLDIVAGFDTGLVFAYQNDGTPFSGLWTATQIFTITGQPFYMAAADLDGDGWVDLATANGTGYSFSVFQNDGTPFSGAWTENSVGTVTDAARFVAPADLDRDGDLDLVTTNFHAGLSAEVNVWQNDGTPFTGTWTLQAVGTTESDSYGVAVGDIDRDGDLDILSTTNAADDYEVIAWQNDETPWVDLWPQTDVAAMSATTYGAVLADLDGDGDLDAAVTTNTGEDYCLAAFQNDGSPWGGPWPQQDIGIPNIYTKDVVYADLDRDGDLDLVTMSNASAAYEVMAWENRQVHASPAFKPGVSVGSVDQAAVNVARGDLDGDGDMDLVTAQMNYSAYEVFGWENISTPANVAFQRRNLGTLSTSQKGLAIGDLDRDGDLDVVTADYSAPYNVNGWQNDGTPWNGAWTRTTLGTGAADLSNVALGDLDRDGDLDVAAVGESAADFELKIWQNDGTPWDAAWALTNAGAGTDAFWDLALGDLDHDGDLDIAVGAHHDEDFEIMVWNNDGTPWNNAWSSTDVGALVQDVYEVTLGDLDQDGDLDVVIGSTESASDAEIKGYINDGTPFSGSWTSFSIYETGENIQGLQLADLDRDGDLDVVAANWPNATKDELAVYWNDGTPWTGSWVGFGIGNGSSNFGGVEVADLDGDGDLEVASPDFSPGDLWIWQNKGGSARVAPTAASPVDLAPGVEAEVMQVAFTHAGIPADLNLELFSWDLHFYASNCLEPLSTGQIQPMISHLRIRLDDGDGVFETSDPLVKEISPLSLAGGAQAVTFTDGAADVLVTPGQTRLYFISFVPTGWGNICLMFNPDYDALVQGKPFGAPAIDFSVSREDNLGVSVLVNLDYEVTFLPLVGR